MVTPQGVPVFFHYVLYQPLIPKGIMAEFAVFSIKKAQSGIL